MNSFVLCSVDVLISLTTKSSINANSTQVAGQTDTILQSIPQYRLALCSKYLKSRNFSDKHQTEFYK